jgi:hypothetical protein
MPPRCLKNPHIKTYFLLLLSQFTQRAQVTWTPTCNTLVYSTLQSHWHALCHRTDILTFSHQIDSIYCTVWFAKVQRIKLQSESLSCGGYHNNEELHKTYWQFNLWERMFVLSYIVSQLTHTNRHGKTKINLNFYFNVQSVPRNKHTPSLSHKPVS